MTEFQINGPADLAEPNLKPDENLSQILAAAPDLQLDDPIMFVGRSLAPEYIKMFDLNMEAMRGTRVLDVASAYASFAVEANDLGVEVTAADRHYGKTASELEAIARPTLDKLKDHDRPDMRLHTEEHPAHWFSEDALQAIDTPRKLSEVRETGLARFLDDYDRDQRDAGGRYINLQLPNIEDSALHGQRFDTILVGNLLFAYAQVPGCDFEFHVDSLVHLTSLLTSDPESSVRVYPAGAKPYGMTQQLKYMLDIFDGNGIDVTFQESEHKFVKGWDHMMLLRQRSELD